MSPKRNKVRNIMTGGTECVSENDTMVEAAKKLAQLNVDALPICGEDETLRGMITEHDLVSRGLALGKNPNETKVGEFGYGKPVTIGAADSLELALKTMTDHNVRRLPVIDGKELIGVISITDVVNKIDTEGQSDPAEGKRN
jgi:CBS domain-containing protein